MLILRNFRLWMGWKNMFYIFCSSCHFFVKFYSNENFYLYHSFRPPSRYMANIRFALLLFYDRLAVFLSRKQKYNYVYVRVINIEIFVWTWITNKQTTKCLRRVSECNCNQSPIVPLDVRVKIKTNFFV